MSQGTTNLLEASLAHHQAGRLQDAERGYRQFLAMYPRHPDGLHLLGLLALQVGQFYAAEQLISQAIQIRPDLPEYRASLFDVQVSTKQADAAIATLKQLEPLSTRSLKALLDLADFLADAGRMIDAIQLYQRAILLSPHEPVLYHHLGIASRAIGKSDHAVEAFERAVALRPGFYDALSHLGDLYCAAGKYDVAVATLRHALAANPQAAEAHFNLGAALLEAGKLPDAIASLESAISLQPAFTFAYLKLATALTRSGQPEVAISILRRRLAGQPNSVELNVALAEQLLAVGRPSEASDVAAKTVSALPPSPIALNCLGVSQFQEGRWDDAIGTLLNAIQAYPEFRPAYRTIESAIRTPEHADRTSESLRAAAARLPDAPEVLAACSRALLLRTEVEPAVELAQRAVRLAPSLPSPRVCLARAFRTVGQYNEAEVEYRAAIDLEPTADGPHFELGLLRLLQGDYKEGWEQYEWRLKNPFNSRLLRSFGIPMWDGSDLAGKRILVWCEQGLGDAIQFCRYVPLLAARGARVVLACRDELAPLFNTLHGVEQVVCDGQAVSDVQFHCPLMSIPYFFGTTLDTVPAAIPYLHADPNKVAVWKERFSAFPTKVGIAWAGAPGHENDRYRSLSIHHLLPLLRIQGVKFISLQKGEAAKELSRIEGNVNEVSDVSPLLQDFSDTAALIQSLDLVISPDSSIIHLAGALGKVSYLLISFAPDWRWGPDQQQSVWYPTARLFRQSRLNDWRDPVERVTAALRDFLCTRSSAGDTIL